MIIRSITRSQHSIDHNVTIHHHWDIGTCRKLVNNTHLFIPHMNKVELNILQRNEKCKGNISYNTIYNISFANTLVNLILKNVLAF